MYYGKVISFRAALDPRLAHLVHSVIDPFSVIKKYNIPYIKWAYQIRPVSHLIIKIREVMRPCFFKTQHVLRLLAYLYLF